MEYLSEFITVAIIHLLGVMSPGPDFALITRNSLAYSRKTGIYSALGIALGITVHIAYCLIGIGLIISQSILLFSAIKMLGATYLIYIGYKSLRAKPNSQNLQKISEKNKDLSRMEAIKSGFLTNALNPKATVFFLSVFTQVINPATPVAIQLIYGVEMVFMTFVWFAFLATGLSHQIIKTRFVKVQHHIERTMGAVLIALGIKIALSDSK